MAITIREKHHPGIWEVVYSGPTDLESRLLTLEAGKGILEAGIVTGVLVDFRQAELIVAKDQAYDLSQARVSDSVFLGVKTALLFNQIPEETDFDIVVARNRGLEFEAFTDEAKALAWLAEGHWSC